MYEVEMSSFPFELISKMWCVKLVHRKYETNRVYWYVSVSYVCFEQAG